MNVYELLWWIDEKQQYILSITITFSSNEGQRTWVCGHSLIKLSMTQDFSRSLKYAKFR